MTAGASTSPDDRPSGLATPPDPIAAHTYVLPLVRPLPRRVADVADPTW